MRFPDHSHLGRVTVEGAGDFDIFMVRVGAAPPAPLPLDVVAQIVRRHTHQGAWAMTRYAGPDPEHDCHLCRALVAAGVLTLDDIGTGTRAAIGATPEPLDVSGAVPPSVPVSDDTDGAGADVRQASVEPIWAGRGDVIGASGGESPGASHPTSVRAGHGALPPAADGDAALGTSSRFHDVSVTGESSIAPLPPVEPRGYETLTPVYVAAPPAPLPLDAIRSALTDEDEIAHGEAVRGGNTGDPRAYEGVGRCAYCDDEWPCRTQRGIDRLLARLATPEPTEENR